MQWSKVTFPTFLRLCFTPENGTDNSVETEGVRKTATGRGEGKWGRGEKGEVELDEDRFIQTMGTRL